MKTREQIYKGEGAVLLDSLLCIPVSTGTEEHR